jgi:type VI secretion system secreted protein Hcp
MSMQTIEKTPRRRVSVKSRILIAVTVSTLALGTVGAVAAASAAKRHALNSNEIYSMSATGLTGEGTAGTGSIEINSFQWGVSRGSTTAATGASAGKAHLNDLTVTREIDAASPTFFSDCYSGKHFTEVDLFIQSAGEGIGGDSLTIKLIHAVVTSVTWNGGAGDTPVENVTFGFQADQIIYKKSLPAS